MSTFNDDLKNLSDSLKQQRDELKVQIHLAKADLKEEWEDLEKQWEQFKAKLIAASHEAGESGKEIVQVTKLLGQEIKSGYERIKEKF